MLNQSKRDTIKAVFPFLVPVVLKCRRIVAAIRESKSRKGTFLDTESIGYPFSSLRVHGAYDRSDMSSRLYHALVNAFGPNSYLPDEVYEIEGMSSRAIRNLFKQVGELDRTSAIPGNRFVER